MNPLILTQVNQLDHEHSIFKTLLTQIELQVTSPQPKSNSHTLDDDSMNFLDLYSIQYPNEQPQSHSEWVWTDSIHQQPSISQDLPPQSAQLQRLQSMRIQQQQKLNQFIRLHNLFPHQEDYEHNPKQSLSLSPKKKKKIDKLDKLDKLDKNTKNHLSLNLFYSHSPKKSKTNSINLME